MSKPDGPWDVSPEHAFRFDELRRRLEVTTAELQGRLNEWGVAARRAAGVPDDVGDDKIVYDPVARRFVRTPGAEAVADHRRREVATQEPALPELDSKKRGSRN